MVRVMLNTSMNFNCPKLFTLVSLQIIYAFQIINFEIKQVRVFKKLHSHKNTNYLITTIKSNSMLTVWTRKALFIHRPTKNRGDQINDRYKRLSMLFDLKKSHQGCKLAKYTLSLFKQCTSMLRFPVGNL